MGFWTPERTARAEQLWREGYLSAKEIAAELGDPGARNRVIGKAGRCGWPQGQVARERTRSYKPSPRPQAAPPVARPRALPFVAPVAVAAPAPARASPNGHPKAHPPGRSIVELASDECRWPMGAWAAAESLRWDPAAKEFCGRSVAAGLPYCAAHARIAYKPAEHRDRRVRY